MRATFGETVVAILLASVIAVLLAIAGWVGAILVCGLVFTGEATESALVLAPFSAIVIGAAVFLVVYRWFIRYGDPPPQ